MQIYDFYREPQMSPVSESGQSTSDHEPFEIEERKEPLSKPQVILLNVTWFGLYVMFLALSVVGKCYCYISINLLIVY